MGILEGKKLLRSFRRRWKDNIKMDLQEVGWGAWTGVGQYGDRCRALVNVVMNLRIPYML